MEIVIDANITVALFVRLPYSDQAETLFRLWRKQGVQLYAPALWPSEVISTLRKVVAAGQMTEEDARQSVAGFALLPVQVVLPEANLLQASLDWAGKLGQIVAYDAQYVALAKHLDAEFWTADNNLFKALEKLKTPSVHWVGEITTDT